MAVKKETRTQRFIGLSTDTKPTGAEFGSTFFEFNTGDTYITPDSSNWYLKESINPRRVKAVMTLSAATAYASFDVLSDSISADKAHTWDFTSVIGYAGGVGELLGAQIQSNANVCSLEPVLFLYTTSSPVSAKIDNAACNSPVHTDISTGVFLGRVNFPNLTVQGASADSNAMAFASQFPVYFLTSSTDNGIHGILMTATAATFPSKEVAITLWVR